MRSTNSLTRLPRGERVGIRRRRSAAISEGSVRANAHQNVAVPRIIRGTGPLPITVSAHVFSRLSLYPSLSGTFSDYFFAFSGFFSGIFSGLAYQTRFHTCI